MTRPYKLLLALLFCFNQSYSQDLFNLDNTLNFANYLKNRGDFSFALEEYHRAYFLSPHNNNIQHEILLINRKLGLFNKSLDFIEKLENSNQINREELFCFLKLKDFKKLNLALNNKNLLLYDNDYYFFKTSTLLLEEKWKEANQYILSLNSDQKNPFTKEYSLIISEKSLIKKKNPYVASVFSILVPGLGKLYTGDKKDALFSFLTICLGAWQATNSFSDSGIHSTSGWIYGGMALFLYSGNIYGSFSSAQKYNGNNQKIINEKINLNIDNFMH
tara:strand:+ start:1468 stop:2292 length:825 start_codon:yes stop_codon:yes gene_type:complete